MSLTVGQLISAIEGLNQLGIDTSAAANLNLANLPADAVVGEDILSVVSLFWPPAAILEMALAVAVVIVPMIHLTPDPDPVHDAQTTQSRGGRNG